MCRFDKNPERGEDLTALANMLCGTVDAEMTIRLKHDECSISGGTGIDIVNLYMLEKALEQLAKRLLPMMKSEEGLKSALKDAIDLMDFRAETT